MDSDKIFITKFDTTAQYNAAKESLAKPHVSLTKDDGKLHYMKELSLIVTINVTQTTGDTPICNDMSNVLKAIIDNVDCTSDISVVGNEIGYYRFTTTGIHTIKFFLKNDYIGEYMFSEIDVISPEHPYVYVTSAILSDGIREVKPFAFHYNGAFTGVTLGNGVERIYDSAFGSCLMTSLTFPRTIKKIDANSFYGCTALTSITIETPVPPRNEGAFGNTNNCPIFVPDSSVTTYKTEWPTYANRIYGFSDKYIIATFYPSSMWNATKILDPMYGLTAVTQVEIDGVVQPSVESTYNFNTLEEHTVKYTLATGTTIGEGMFDGCTEMASVKISNRVTSISGHAFANCSGLTSVTIGSNVTSIGNGAFTLCSGLTSIEIPNSVTNIENAVFQNCEGLTSVTIGSGVTSIGRMAFYACSNLGNIKSFRSTAPTIYDNTFDNVKSSGILYVPQGSTGYNTWLSNSQYYLGYYNWTMGTIDNM